MPGPITHLIVMQRLSQFLREVGGDNGAYYAQMIEDGNCSPYAAFGSIGPDYLFFSLKEYGTPLDELTKFMFNVYDALDPLIEFYEDTIEPVVDEIEDAIAAVDEALFKGLIADIKHTTDMLSATAVTAAAAVATKGIDLFYPFYPKVQKGAPEDEWYWFDFLHTRRTGRFVSTMWELAGNDADLQRYVLGYASHFSTDTVGHPFVNAVTGGPYRMHWHRHHLVENWIDAYSRWRYNDSRRTMGCLGIGDKDTYVADAISGSYYYRLTEFPHGKLPGKLSKLIADAMNATYQGADHPVFLGQADLDSTYRLWQAWFKRTTTIGDVQPPTPVPPPGAVVVGLVNNYVNGLPSFPGGGGAPSGGFSIAGVFAAIAAFIKWLGDVLAYTGQWLFDHAGDILSLPYDEAIGTAKWFQYQIQKGLWEIYDNLRFMLVLGGYLNPEPRDLNKNPWGQTFINTSFAHLTGGGVASSTPYPLRQESHSLLFTTEHHLIYPNFPNPNRETPFSESAPNPFYGVWPEAFISRGYNYDPAIERLYDCIKPYGPNKTATHYVDMKTVNTGQLGNALFFSARLISWKLKDMPNFNLDGDRGYGWKTWSAEKPKAIENNQPQNPINVDVNYIDA